MKRVNIRDAFVGEPNPRREGLANELGGDADPGAEALLVAVRGGEITFVVPAGTDDARAIEHAQFVRGVVHLENERVLTFEIQAEATGAFFEDEPAAQHRRRQTGGSVGLSAITSGHDYMADTTPLSGREIMTADPITVRPDQTVQEAAERLLYHHISGVPVLDAENRLVGIVSEADLIEKQGDTVAEVMSRNVIAVDVDDPVEQIASAMARAQVKRVPVLHEGRLVGIISRADVVRFVAGRRATLESPEQPHA